MTPHAGYRLGNRIGWLTVRSLQPAGRTARDAINAPSRNVKTLGRSLEFPGVWSPEVFRRIDAEDRCAAHQVKHQSTEPVACHAAHSRMITAVPLGKNTLSIILPSRPL